MSRRGIHRGDRLVIDDPWAEGRPSQADIDQAMANLRSAAHARGITDQEARVKNRAIEAFKLWLLAPFRTRAELESVDAEALAAKYPPLTAEDLAQMCRVRAKSLK